MRKADIVGSIAEKTGIPKVDILVALETFFKEVKTSLVEGEPVYVRGFGSFILKKRAAHYITLAVAIILIALLYWGGNTVPPAKTQGANPPAAGVMTQGPNTMKP